MFESLQARRAAACAAICAGAYALVAFGALPPREATEGDAANEVGAAGVAGARGNGEPALLLLTPAAGGLPAASGAATATAEALIAPLGVPTRNIGTAAEPREIPATFRVRAALPGFLGPEVRIDLESLGAGERRIDGAEAGEDSGGSSPASGLPPTGFTGSDGLVLHRLAENPWEEGSGWYESDVVVAIADLRAARAYTRSASEDEPGRCIRCDAEALHVPPAARELLSGEIIRASFPPALVAQLTPTYGAEALRRGGHASARAVRWEMTPALRQEPARNASGGTGDVVPGTILHSGEFTTAAVDLAVRGRGLDVALARTYRNQTIGAGPLGPGWELGYRLRLRPLPNRDIELYDGRGRRELFARQSDGTLKAPAGLFSELFESANGYLLLDPSHASAHFDRWGRLIRLTDAVKDRPAAGNEINFLYDDASHLVGIEDDLGREFELEYDDGGRLVKIRDFDEREVRYEYDAAGRLERVISPAIGIGDATFPNGLTTRYEYSDPPAAGTALAQRLAGRDNLVAIEDARGEIPIEVSYEDGDGDGRPDEVARETWGGFPLALAIDFEAHQTIVIDRRGQTREYGHNASGQLVRFEDPLHAVSTSTIDAEGLVTHSAAPLGRATDMTYDVANGRRSRGNVLQIAVTADNRGDNGSSHVLATQIEYDTYSNQPTKITDPRGAVTLIARGATGLPMAITEAAGTADAGSTAIVYNDFGQPTRVTNPNGNVTTYEYFGTGTSKGYLRQVKVDPDGLALVTKFETDSRGNVLSTIDPRGVRSEAVWNEVDWLVATKAAASAATDGSGSPALGYETRFLHDENGNVVEERIPSGDDGGQVTRIQRDYGVLGELVEIRREVTPSAADWIVERRSYDANFNLTSITHPEGELTLQGYDERDLLSSVTRGAGSADPSTEGYGYDAEGSRISFTNARGYVRSTALDGFGRVKSSVDPLGDTSAAIYDNGSNVVLSRSFDTGGLLLAESSAAFDLRGRPKSSSAKLWAGSNPAAARLVTSSTSYDAAGNVRTVTDPLGRISSQTYDKAERPVVAVDPAGNRVERTLDRGGNSIRVALVERVDGGAPVTTTLTATFDALGRATSSTDALGNVASTTYDAHGNPRLAIDAEGHLSESVYDGADRLVRTSRPEGIAVDYAYDRSSRLVSYRDALNHSTAWTYDALGRRRVTIYPDSTQETASYDGAGNATELADGNGTLVHQAFDPASRLSSRSIVRASGVEGPTTETFAYDGLSRLTRVQSGTNVTTSAYDSLSRRLSETTNGKSIANDFDDAGNLTLKTYPSGTTVAQGFDELNRATTISSSGSALAGYGFRGADLVVHRSLGNGLSGGTVFDGGRRPISTSLAGTSFEPFTERLAWSPRNLKTASQRDDLNGAGYVAAYDGAGRLVEAARTENPLALAPNNSVPSAASIANLPESFAFHYDAAENLVEQTPEKYTISGHQGSPADGSGRNRPGSFAGQTLVWDGAGNLIRKGPLHFSWDYRNRLTRVTRDGAGEVARYDYDAFNRLVKREAAGDTEEWVWSDWRLLERYENGLLHTRRIYGQGLDEVVRQETDENGDGVLETVTVPVYDSIGNAVAITDAAGRAIERYEYSPYGNRTIRVDLTPPVVEQLREADGNLVLEFSEEVRLDRLQAAIAAGSLTLRDTTDAVPVAVTAGQPVRDGKQKGRRVILTPDPGHPPTALHGMHLTISAAAIVDLFENHPVAEYSKDFVWTGEAHTIDDTARPRVELLLAKSGGLELQFSEEIDPAVASATILLDGQTRTWLAQPDGYTLVPQSALAATTHTLQIGPSLIDKSGQSLETPFTQNVTTGAADSIVFERPDPRVTPTSTLDNLASFQGHLTDPATGLVYMRNRWLDPEMGRFLSEDPLQSIEDVSSTAPLRYNPLGVRDQLGLYEEDVHLFLTTFLAEAAGFSARTARFIGESTQDLDRDGRDATKHGVSQRNMRLYHFVSEQRLLSMGAKARSSSSLNNTTARSIGEFLHALEDSFSHQVHETRRVRDFYYSGLRTPGGWNIGHGLEGHEPDWTWMRWPLAMEMARAVYLDLAVLCLKYQDECAPTDYAAIVQPVFDFVVFEPELIPESTYVPLLTVADYGRKVGILNSAFGSENNRESEARRRRRDRLAIYLRKWEDLK
ncbi:MAG: RHS repeat-associated core domain-containing protein [Thermoanaerobaculia bacterium]